jgi:hypothetical protein
MMKKMFLTGLTALMLLPVWASELPLPLPLLVAESEAFEIVGRLEENALILHVDRGPDNSPVLAATLSVEAGGKEVEAQFRAESGDYRIDDALWLAPLRAAGEHALSFTLIAGEEADLLVGDLVVQAASEQQTGHGFRLTPLWGTVLLAGFGGLAAWWGWGRMKRRQLAVQAAQSGGAA